MPRLALATLSALVTLNACSSAPTAPGSSPPSGAETVDAGSVVATTPAAISPWSLLDGAPAPTSDPSIVIDATHDRLLAMGVGSNAVWAQDLAPGGAWKQIATTGEAPPPVGFVTAFDDARGSLVVFPDTTLERAWILDASGAWSLVGFDDAPAIAAAFSIAIDPVGRRIFAFTSGEDPIVVVAPLDGERAWSQIASAPAASLDYAYFCRDRLVFDAARSRLVLISGGWPRGNVFALSLGAAPTWTTLVSTMTWYDYGAALTYDPVLQRAYAMTEQTSAWVWMVDLTAATPEWTHLPIGGAPIVARASAGAVYDAVGRRAIFFAGEDATGLQRDDTLALNLDGDPVWSTVGALDQTALTSDGAQLVWDSDHARAMKFGAVSDYGAPLATQAFDATSGLWLTLGDAPPSGLTAAPGIWDAVGQRLVRFGGAGSVDVDTTQARDADGTWTTLATNGPTPPARAQHTSVLDAGARRMITFGGTQSGDGSTYLTFQDTWSLALDDLAWTQIQPVGALPPARSTHAAAFDPAHHRMLVHGGQQSGVDLDDAWILDLSSTPTWQQVVASGDAPPAIHGHFAIYDAAGDRFLVIGAAPAPATIDGQGVQVWALTLGAAPQWEALCATGLRPLTLDGAASTDRGIFVASQGSAWRFDPTRAKCR